MPTVVSFRTALQVFPHKNFRRLVLPEKVFEMELKRYGKNNISAI